ncbi:MAG: hypothetical protein ACD_42C00002G0004 [uncultured bacterium]|nr:MAG: hypothetical protein ACD_42C00002G0004 [uncultured bacterium]OGT33904.1 MAG: hypothetical protein A3C44_02590 [Gammaproteobacteria bacterium RIFCSPHIGHO2_02_FULL_39_13]OGT50155.1 MAG: hypothetical protein A3E53_01895 [Gammaproteobacteria bacterium RIFCSPHIGHO2_12_FULL_39_24]
MFERSTWLLKATMVSIIIILCNYPIAYAVCHDITLHFTTLITTILIISLLYGFSTLCGPHHFHSILIGILAGDLIALLTWVVSFRELIFHLTDTDKLSILYSLGVAIPAGYQFFLSIKRDRSSTHFLHILLTALIYVVLMVYLFVRLYFRLIHDSTAFEFFHFTLGFSVGLLTAIVIHIILTRNLLVFEKLSYYLDVMAKPVIAFFLGYLLIMFIFAGLYTMVYFTYNDAFTRLSSDVFGDLLFYSFSTITGLGISVIVPHKPIVLFLTIAENFLGLVWMSVVFAAALAYLQSPFQRISRQLEMLVKAEEKKSP